MKEFITPDRIANSIIQRQSKFENFVLVEGSHDRLFIMKFKNEKTQIELAFGWEKLVDIIKILKKRGYEKVLGIIDKDLREIIPEQKIDVDFILFTDHHDLNILCLEKTFPLIFSSYCSDEKVEDFEPLNKFACVKDYIYYLIKPLAFLKILNKREKLHLSFKSNSSSKNAFDYSKFIDKSSFEIVSIKKMIETVINFSQSKTTEKILPIETLLIKLNNIIEKENYENCQIISGHDFGMVITLGLKKALGTKDIDSDTFLKESILAYEKADFYLTNLYKNIIKIQELQKTKYLL